MLNFCSKKLAIFCAKLNLGSPTKYKAKVLIHAVLEGKNKAYETVCVRFTAREYGQSTKKNHKKLCSISTYSRKLG